MNKQRIVEIDLRAICVNGCDFIGQPKFPTVVTHGPDTDSMYYVGGAGRIISSGEAVKGLFLAQRVAFCGFVSGRPQGIVETTPHCIAPIPEGLSYSDAAASSAFVPIIAAMNAARISLGEDVLIVCRDTYRGLAEKVADAFGCRAFVLDLAEIGTARDSSGKIMEQTAGHGVDAIVILHARSSAIWDRLPAEICHHSERIIFAEDTGLGFQDAAYMHSEVEYPRGYVGRTTRGNLVSALGLVAEKRICPALPIISVKDYESGLGGSAIDGRPFVVLGDGSEPGIDHGAVKDITDELGPQGLPSVVTRLRNLLADQITPCLILISARCSKIDPAYPEELMSLGTSIAGGRIATCHKHGDGEVISVSASLTSGSVIVVTIASGFLRESVSYEVHWDGKTATSSQDNRIKVW